MAKGIIVNFTTKEIKKIIELKKLGITQTNIAKRFNVSNATITEILKKIKENNT